MIRAFFEGRVTFTIEGCDYMLLNRLRKFCVSGVQVKECSLCFTVPLRFQRQVEMMIARQEYTVKTNSNFFGVLNVFYSRLALSIAVLVCILAFFVLNGFVFNVKIIGVESEQERQVSDFVRSYGARPFVRKSNNSVHEIASLLPANFDFVAHASSKVVGNTLIVSVYTVTVAGEIQNSDIVATVDGVVTNLVVASGRAMVSVGDAVRAGQVLISAQRQVGAIDIERDEYGKLIQEGIFVPSRAVGEVLADVQYTEYGVGITFDELLAKIVERTGIQNFDRVEQFSAVDGTLEVVATINKSIV